MADKERYDTSTTSYPPGVEQASNEAYIQSIITAMKTAGIVGASDSITGEQIAPIIAAVRMGVDVSDATANDYDVVGGKTFYAGIGKRTGAMQTLQHYDTGPSISVSGNGLITAVQRNPSSQNVYMAPNTSTGSSKQLNIHGGGNFYVGSTEELLINAGTYVINNLYAQANGNKIIKSSTGQINRVRGNNQTIITGLSHIELFFITHYGTIATSSYGNGIFAEAFTRVSEQPNVLISMLSANSGQISATAGNYRRIQVNGGNVTIITSNLDVPGTASWWAAGY